LLNRGQNEIEKERDISKENSRNSKSLFGKNDETVLKIRWGTGGEEKQGCRERWGNKVQKKPGGKVDPENIHGRK